MKRIIITIMSAVLLFVGCDKLDVPEKLSYNSDPLTEDLCVFLDSASPEDKVTVNVEIKRTDADDDGIKELLADDYNISLIHSENIEYAVQTGDYSRIEEYVERYYKNTHNYYNAPKYEDNIEAARSSYVAEYFERYGRARLDFYNDIVKCLPFPGEEYVNNHDNMFLVRECTTTAELLCELSRHERVERITGWIREPAKVPEKLIGGVTQIKLTDGLQVSITLEKNSYNFGETVRYRATVLNTGEGDAILELRDPDSLYPNVEFGFYENGVLREDISSGYANIFVEGEGKYKYLYSEPAESSVPSDMILKHGESATFHIASTPHSSSAYGKTPVSPEAEWEIRLSFDYVIDGKEGHCEYEVPVAHTDG